VAGLVSRAPVDGGSRRPLPVQRRDIGRSDDLHAGLDEAFAREVATRLPRLLAAAKRLADSDPVVAGRAVAELRTDVHTLASSAVIVGAVAAARAGRECEWLLLPYDDGVLPADVAAKAAALARGVGRALARWTSG
jgi:hypothetical protein